MSTRISRQLLQRLPTMRCPVKLSITMILQAIDKSKQLFSSTHLRYTGIMVVINFTIQFGYYGLWLWFPELFNKLNLYYSANPNASVTVCEVIDLQVGWIQSLKLVTTMIQMLKNMLSHIAG